MLKPQLNSIVPRICNLPPVSRLSNGVELNVIPLDTTELIAVCVMFNGGQWVQDKKLQSDFALNQIRSGSESISSNEITENLDFYGATLTAGTNMSFSFVQLMSLRRTLHDSLSVFADLLSHPTFEQDKLNNGIEEMLFAYNVSRQKASEVCKRQFYRKVLGEHNPAAQFPEEQDYHDVTRADLLRYHKQFMQMGNAVVYVTGKIDDCIIQLIDSTLGALPCQQPSLVAHPKAEFPVTTAAIHEYTLPVPAVQSALRMGKVLPDSDHPDYPALLLAGTVLGGYFGSRLMSNIRERLGYTYGIGSTFYHVPHANVFIVATETSKEYVTKCIDEIKKEIELLRTTPISQDEMTSVKNYLLGQFCRMTETSLSLSTVMMSKRAFGQTLSDMLTQHQTIQSLTPAQVQQVAHTYLSPDEMLVTAVHGK